jgi:hypothetical protein
MGWDTEACLPSSALTLGGSHTAQERQKFDQAVLAAALEDTTSIQHWMMKMDETTSTLLGPICHMWFRIPRFFFPRFFPPPFGHASTQ